ncbi:uncharacterized protein LOC136076304 [Hydra vulgaris]|uniref:Uncharacterized protein LOC136076304 n=1 Tax=Hydra vulgaris TaxID=6087 RepID=A0ABM4BAF5_HYDVU
MISAIKHVRSEPSFSVRKAEILYNVPRITLRDRISGKVVIGVKPGIKPHDYITRNVDQGVPVDVVLLDFAKAFDTVPHQRLISKLKAYGISGLALNWFQAFLSNRRQRVVMEDYVSTWAEVYSRVPQGSVLGPLLFILYINDLPESLKNNSKLYADDTKIICKLNTSDSERDLGVIFSDNLKWKNPFAVPVWAPYQKQDIVFLEKVQRRATKLIPQINKLCYEDRLACLRMPSLVKRRQRGDIIQLYKIFNGYDKIEFTENHSFKSNCTRGHILKYSKDFLKHKYRENILLNRAANYWNALPETVVKAISINSFKARLDRCESNHHETQLSKLSLAMNKEKSFKENTDKKTTSDYYEYCGQILWTNNVGEFREDIKLVASEFNLADGLTRVPGKMLKMVKKPSEIAATTMVRKNVLHIAQL